MLAAALAVALSACGSEDDADASRPAASDAGATDTRRPGPDTGRPHPDATQDAVADATADGDDPCGALDQCTAVDPRCEGEELVVCAPDARGCLVETRTDCAAAEDGFCDATADPPACATGEDPCAGPLECDPSTYVASCEGDQLTECVTGTEGCHVEQTRDCSVEGLVCTTEGGQAGCGSALAVCETMAVIDCETGTLRGDTAGGSNLLEGYECVSLSYPGNEAIYELRVAVVADVVVTATRISSTADFDLFALDARGAACDDTLVCLDRSIGVGATEVVEFPAEPGQPIYVVYDAFADGVATTTFDLQVVCSLPECGNGLVEAGEACDDGRADEGDGCYECAVEEGFRCFGEPSTCVDASGTCDDPIETEAGLWHGDTTGFEALLSDYGGACLSDSGSSRPADGPEVIYAVTVPPGHMLTASLVGEHDEALALLDDCGEPDSCLAYVDPPGEAAGFYNDADVATQIFVVADGYFSWSEGPYDLDISVHAVDCGDGAVEGGEECDDGNEDDDDGCSTGCTLEEGATCVGQPSFCFFGGDRCDEALLLEPGSYSLDSTDFANDYDDYGGDCGEARGAAGPDLVVAVDVPADARLSASMEGETGFDVALAVAATCPDVAGSCLAFSDDWVSLEPESVSVDNLSDGIVRYLIVADGYNADDYGEFTLIIDITEL